MKKRGGVLIAVLLLLALLLIIGMALLGKESYHLQAAGQTAHSEAAYELAMAGLEEARVKLDKDIRFPPHRDSEQPTFSYTEEVADVDGGPVVGRYEVTLDRRWEGPPYQVWRIRVVGTLGTLEDPLAQRTLTATLDVAPDRGGPNPNFWNFIEVTDSGSL